MKNNHTRLRRSRTSKSLRSTGRIPHTRGYPAEAIHWLSLQSQQPSVTFPIKSSRLLHSDGVILKIWVGSEDQTWSYSLAMTAQNCPCQEKNVWRTTGAFCSRRGGRPPGNAASPPGALIGDSAAFIRASKPQRKTFLRRR